MGRQVVVAENGVRGENFRERGGVSSLRKKEFSFFSLFLYFFHAHKKGRRKKETIIGRGNDHTTLASKY